VKDSSGILGFQKALLALHRKSMTSKLPLHRLRPIREKVLGRRAKRVWPGTTTTWVAWVGRMKKFKSEEWGELGIEGAIQLFTIPF
jgi:hypothetical protein